MSHYYILSILKGGLFMNQIHVIPNKHSIFNNTKNSFTTIRLLQEDVNSGVELIVLDEYDSNKIRYEIFNGKIITLLSRSLVDAFKEYKRESKRLTY